MAGQRVSSGEADDRLNARGVSVEAERTLTEMQTIWEEVRTRLVLEQAKQKKYADERRSDVTYAVGDQVMLSTENLKTTDGKLTDKYLGPYVVSEVREGGRSVRLALGGAAGQGARGVPRQSAEAGTAQQAAVDGPRPARAAGA